MKHRGRYFLNSNARLKLPVGGGSGLKVWRNSQLESFENVANGLDKAVDAYNTYKDENGGNSTATGNSSESTSVYYLQEFNVPQTAAHGDTIHADEIKVSNGDSSTAVRVVRFDTTGRKTPSEIGTWKPSERLEKNK